MIRRPAVAGQFYPSSKSSLLSTLEDCFLDSNFGPGKLPSSQNLDQRTIIGGISPHAGYVYSGSAAAHTYLSLFKEKMPDTVLIYGTDHIGYGKIALMKEGSWETPLGELEIDTELCEAIINKSKIIANDPSAFMGSVFSREHNIEVQLPFIQFCARAKNIKIVPVIISSHDYRKLQQLSADVAEAITSLNKDVVLIASSDMTHKELYNAERDFEEFKQLDQNVINAFTEFNPERTFNMARKTTVCGPQTITSLMLTCKNLGYSKTEALKYYTSFEKSHNLGYCVGYFSGIISK